MPCRPASVLRVPALLPLVLLAAVGLPLVAVSAAQPVSFELDIQPILTSSGCNSGACHGKQRGQNGFQLSLLGFDSDFDYEALTRQGRGRRLFPAAPHASLLLQKATAELSHGGGPQIDPASADYETLIGWIEQGAPRQIPGEPILEKVELTEAKFSLEPGQRQPLQLTAFYSDGSTRDVTRWTNYLSNDGTVVSVDKQGELQAGELPGETAVMARYMNHIAVADVVIPQADKLPASFYAELPRQNFIDDLVIAKWEKLAIKPSPPADDAVLLRRLYTDLIGRLPTAAEATAYLADAGEDKRQRLIDQLLERPEYADHWANQWADLLRPNPYRVGIKAVLNYDNWIRQQFRDDVPYDAFARQLVTAKGSTWQNGAATLYRDRRSPDEIATLVSQLFLGVRLECAKGHHRPFEKWSQRNFYEFAAFFARVDRKGTRWSPPISGGEEIVFAADKGEVRHPVTDEVLPPRPLFGDLPATEHDADPRQQLAAWMTSPENPYFAQVQVNRLWAALMGRGLVDPVDDLRSTNPPTNPDLLDALAESFRASGYSLKQLLKTIASSQVYGLRSLPNDTNVSDRLNYSRHYRHRLRAEVLLDAVADVTETEPTWAGMPDGARANQVWTHRVNSLFLDTFGRPNENQDPPCERTSDATVTQALHLMNAPQIDDWINSDDGRVARLAKSDRDPEAIAEELYLVVYSRRPQPSEREYVTRLLADAKDDRRGVLADLVWAMLNTPEFSI